MIRVALYRGRSCVSRLIQWQTRSPYSHAALLLADGRVIESWAPCGVCVCEPGHAHSEGTPVDVFYVPELQHFTSEVIYRAAESQIGKRYDYRGVLRFVSRRRESRSDQDAWFCSELVYWAFRAAGVNLLLRTEPWEVSPGLLSRSPLLIPDHRPTFTTTRSPS